MITNGALQGFVLLARREARGQRVLIEQPTYDRAIKILQESGASLATVQLDDEGITPESLEDAMRIAENRGASSTRSRPSRTRAAARCRPTGAQRIVELAGFYNLQVVEDDPYGLIRYEGEPQPSLFELSGKTFIYSSSFSKTISPGLRVGWYILPEELAGEITEDAASTYITPVLLNQAIAYEFIRRGNFEPNLERINGPAQGAARRDARGAREAPLRLHVDAARRAATSSGSSSRRARSRRTCSRRPRASRSSPASTAAACRTRRGSRSASSPPRRSSSASSGSPQRS